MSTIVTESDIISYVMANFVLSAHSALSELLETPCEVRHMKCFASFNSSDFVGAIAVYCVSHAAAYS